VTVGTGRLADAEIHERPEEAMAARAAIANQRVRINGSVLVAEDGIDNQALIAAKLQETGLTIELVPNGQLACERALAAVAAGKPFDVILMDVQMPVMDGFTATQQLRGKGYRGAIIALTANAMDRDRTKCLNAGCNDFVTKPIQMEALFKAIGRYLAVIPVVPALVESTAPAAATAAVPVNVADSARRFYQDLTAELAQIEQAIERQDRVRLKDLAQLILGRASAAGLKEAAPQAAKLLQAAECEPSWMVVGQVATEFARDAQSATQRQAA